MCATNINCKCISFTTSQAQARIISITFDLKILADMSRVHSIQYHLRSFKIHTPTIVKSFTTQGTYVIPVIITTRSAARCACNSIFVKVKHTKLTYVWEMLFVFLHDQHLLTHNDITTQRQVVS